jgi:hypothetical protein
MEVTNGDISFLDKFEEIRYPRGMEGFGVVLTREPPAQHPKTSRHYTLALRELDEIAECILKQTPSRLDSIVSGLPEDARTAVVRDNATGFWKGIIGALPGAGVARASRRSPSSAGTPEERSALGKLAADAKKKLTRARGGRA